MKEARIDEVLDLMSKTSMIYLPAEALTSVELRDKNSAYHEEVARELEMRSQTVEDNVIELVNKFVGSIHGILIDEIEKYHWLNHEKISKPTVFHHHQDATKFLTSAEDYDTDQLKNDCMEVYSYFNQKNIDSLVKATRQSLDVLRKRAGASSVLIRTKHDPNFTMPMFKGDVLLKIPNVTLSPSVEIMQGHFSSILQSLLEVPKSVIQWGQRNIPFAKQRKASILTASSRTSAVGEPSVGM